MRETDEVLVQRSQNGEQVAFEKLICRTGRLVYARLYLQTGNRELAEDLTQETFLTAWRCIRQVTHAQAFRPWLLSIAMSVHTDSLRRSGRRKRGGDSLHALREGSRLNNNSDALAAIPDRSPGPANAAEKSELRQRMLGALRQMPENYRQPLMLRYLADCDYGQIEQQLGLSNGALRGLLHRGMEMLRELMKERPS